MIAFLILTGLLLAAVVYAVVLLVMFVVASVRYHNGKITQKDLDEATEFRKKLRAERKRRRIAEYYDAMHHLGY